MTTSNLIWFSIVSEDSKQLLIDFSEFYLENHMERGIALFKTEILHFSMICVPFHLEHAVQSSFKTYGVRNFNNVDYSRIVWFAGDKKALEV
jgi:hypothetical protein